MLSDVNKAWILAHFQWIELDKPFYFLGNPITDKNISFIIEWYYNTLPKDDD